MIQTDTSPSSSLAVCRADRGGCGDRSPVYSSRAKALAWAAKHREARHPRQAADSERKRMATV